MPPVVEDGGRLTYEQLLRKCEVLSADSLERIANALEYFVEQHKADKQHGRWGEVAEKVPDGGEETAS